MYGVRDSVDWDITDISILSSAITISTHQELISSSIIAPKWASWLQSFCMGVKVSVHTDSAWDCLLLEDQCLLQLIFCLILQLIFLFAAVPFLYTLMIWIHQVLLRLLDDCRYLFIPEVPNDFRIDLVFLSLLQTNSSLRCEVYIYMGSVFLPSITWNILEIKQIEVDGISWEKSEKCLSQPNIREGLTRMTTR